MANHSLTVASLSGVRKRGCLEPTVDGPSKFLLGSAGHRKICKVTAKNLLEEVLSLPAVDRRQLVEHLWDSLQTDSTAFPLTDEQRLTLNRRAAEMDRDSKLGSCWDDVKARILPKQ